MTGRWMLSVSAVLICGAVACQTAASAPGRAPATRPAREKAPVRTVRSDALAPAAVVAVDKDGFAAFAAGLEPDLTAVLRDLSKADVQQVTILAAFREFGRYFGRVTHPTPEQRATLRWLATRPRLLPVLM